MDLQTRIPICNGTSIPCVGFGTWKTPNDEAAASVAEALRVGYRHIDTATAYGNEAGVGKAIAESGIPREEIFLTSKLWNPHQGYQSTLDAFERSLEKLQTWRAFEKLYHDGRIKAIGVSNFRPRHLENLFNNCEIKPMVDQIEIHPGMAQDDMLAYCREHDMVVEGWSPMATGRIFSVPEVQELAAKYNRTVAQVVLRWHVQRGVIPLPKSVTPSRIAENSRIFDFELEPQDMARISALTDCGWSGLNPDNLVY